MVSNELLLKRYEAYVKTSETIMNLVNHYVKYGKRIDARRTLKEGEQLLAMIAMSEDIKDIELALKVVDNMRPWR